MKQESLDGEATNKSNLLNSKKNSIIKIRESEIKNHGGIHGD